MICIIKNGKGADSSGITAEMLQTFVDILVGVKMVAYLINTMKKRAQFHMTGFECIQRWKG